jgi:hypothetical protein
LRIVNENYETISIEDVDLEKGFLNSAFVIREDAEPIDDVTKFAWDDDDYEEVQMYCLYSNYPEPTPTPNDYEARIAALEAELEATKILLGVE